MVERSGSLLSVIYSFKISGGLYFFPPPLIDILRTSSSLLYLDSLLSFSCIRLTSTSLFPSSFIRTLIEALISGLSVPENTVSGLWHSGHWGYKDGGYRPSNNWSVTIHGHRLLTHNNYFYLCNHRPYHGHLGWDGTLAPRGSL